MPAARNRIRSIPATQFKATCLRLIDEVGRGKLEVIITKHRKPVARLVPVKVPDAIPFLGRSPGMFESRGDLVAPVAPDWEPDADL